MEAHTILVLGPRGGLHYRQTILCHEILRCVHCAAQAAPPSTQLSTHMRPTLSAGTGLQVCTSAARNAALLPCEGRHSHIWTSAGPLSRGCKHAVLQRVQTGDSEQQHGPLRVDDQFLQASRMEGWRFV